MKNITEGLRTPNKLWSTGDLDMIVWWYAWEGRWDLIFAFSNNGKASKWVSDFITETRMSLRLHLSLARTRIDSKTFWKPLDSLELLTKEPKDFSDRKKTTKTEGNEVHIVTILTKALMKRYKCPRKTFDWPSKMRSEKTFIHAEQFVLTENYLQPTWSNRMSGFDADLCYTAPYY